MIKGIKNFNGKNLTPEEYLSSQLDYPEPIVKAVMPDSRFTHVPNKYSVGEITACLRKSYFDRSYGRYETVDNLIRSQVGDAIHKSFLKEYDMHERQMSLDFVHNKEKLSIMGKFDGYDFRTKTLVDIKTKPDISWITKPYPNNILQLQCFATLAQTTLNLEIDRLQVIFIDFKEIKPFEIPFKDQLDFMKQRTTMLHEAVIKRQVPKEEASPLCQNCSFNQKCSLPSYHLIPKTLRR